MELNVLTLLFILSVSGRASAKDLVCPKGLSVKDIAKALIQVELSGIQNSGRSVFRVLITV
ncbi:MAG: hypothetical protein K9K67_15565 [Bacteriovoracaceae bacterium]|nr:hypothetical protein [Bacteriovoracaceae bacterium]